MPDISLDAGKARELLEVALEDSGRLFAALDAAPLDAADPPLLVSVWQPSEDIHIADVLVARVLSALALQNCKASVFFSNYLSGDDLREDEERQAASRFYYSFFSELFHKFCHGDRVQLTRMFPSEIKCSDEVKAAYLDLRSSKDEHFPAGSKILDKEWPWDEGYALPLIGLFESLRPQLMVCGRKHEWIWGPFVFRVLGDAGIPVPDVIYIKNISGLNTEVLNEKDPQNCLYVASPTSEVIRQLSRVTGIRTNPCLLTLFEWFVFPAGASCQISGRDVRKLEHWREAEGRPEDMCSAATELIWTALSEIRNIVQLHKRLVSPPAPYVVTNTSMVDVVEGSLRFGSDVFQPLGDDAPLDSDPHAYRSSYTAAGSKVFDLLGGTDADVRVIIGLLQQCGGIDRLLTLFKKRHRDHFSHQFNVYGLGVLFLRCLATGRKVLRQVMAEALDLAEPEVDLAWATAAILHDHAYPLEYLFELQPRMHALVREPKEKALLERLNEAMMRSVPSVYCEPLWPRGDNALNYALEATTMAWNKVTGNAKLPGPLQENRLTHGLLAMANIWHKLQAPDPDQLKPWLLHALVAIARHDLDCNVCFEQEPLTALLVLCDELHEWGRPILAKDGYACPIKSLSLNLSPRLDGRWDMPRRLQVEFLGASREVLEAAEWKEEIFWSGKQVVMNRVKLFTNGTHPAELEMSLRIPSRVYRG